MAISSGVTVPLWAFVLLCVLAAWAVVGSLLLPSVRWFLRRRINRVIDEINERLELKIQPFNLTARQSLIDRLMYDPDVTAAAEEYAREKGMSRNEVMAQVEAYAREIVPSFNAYAYFRVGYWLARNIARSLYRVRLGYADDEGLARVRPDASVVFVMNHRSNMDYILVAYLAATKSALSYAVGEWARIWPLQGLIKSLGAYFIRRNSNNPLYRKVLARYVQMATEGGVVQAVFPEGGLSRDGALQPQKLGLLSYMVTAFDPQGPRDLVFVPVGVNYDRALEDRTLVRSTHPEAIRKTAPAVILIAARFALHNFWLMLRRRWHRFGYAGVNFGSPVSMREYSARRGVDFRKLEKEALFREVKQLGEELMESVAGVIPVLPVSLVATALLRNEGRKLGELELKAAVFALMRQAEAAGAHVYIPRSDQEYAVSVGLRMLTLRRLAREDNGMYSANPDELELLRYYANSIAHFLDGPRAAPGD